MGRIIPQLVPRVSRLLHGAGERIRLARLRRKYSSETVAQRAGITRRTLTKVEGGEPSVALGVYVRVLQVLRLENDLEQIAANDVLGRRLQDAGITPKRRAPKKTAASREEAGPGQSGESS